jgi:nucleoside-diphosphate-sugar epimerase
LKFFISGGAGFIGSHMSEHLLSEGHEVKVFDVIEFKIDTIVPEARKSIGFN